MRGRRSAAADLTQPNVIVTARRVSPLRAIRVAGATKEAFDVEEKKYDSRRNSDHERERERKKENRGPATVDHSSLFSSPFYTEISASDDRQFNTFHVCV